ncbi:hypothetical protein McpSp1_14850 [Methanocorpusculaceae archaeon Sp1]|nr:hypothetical protein [Methanocorpusculaceae archaeon Sp1]
MFQKYEAKPSGLIFGGVFALILSIFGLQAFNNYLLTTSEVIMNEMYITIAGDIIGIAVGLLGLAMLISGIYYAIKARKEPKCEDQ